MGMMRLGVWAMVLVCAACGTDPVDPGGGRDGGNASDARTSDTATPRDGGNVGADATLSDGGAATVDGSADATSSGDAQVYTWPWLGDFAVTWALVNKVCSDPLVMVAPAGKSLRLKPESTVTNPPTVPVYWWRSTTPPVNDWPSDYQTTGEDRGAVLKLTTPSGVTDCTRTTARDFSCAPMRFVQSGCTFDYRLDARGL